MSIRRPIKLLASPAPLDLSGALHRLDQARKDLPRDLPPVASGIDVWQTFRIHRRRRPSRRIRTIREMGCVHPRRDRLARGSSRSDMTIFDSTKTLLVPARVDVPCRPRRR